MGRVHLEQLRRVEYVDVVAVVGRELKSAQKLGAGYGVDAADDYRKLLQDPELDAVHVCTPNAYALSDGERRVAGRQAVLCEKPVTISVRRSAGTSGFGSRDETSELRVPQSALLPDGAADAPDARSRRARRDSGCAGNVFAGLDAVSTRTGTGV